MGSNKSKAVVGTLNPNKAAKILAAQDKLHVIHNKPIISQCQLKAFEAQAIVFSCMDFQLIDDIVIFLTELGYNNNFDQFILAGCSLTFAKHEFKQWRIVAKDHLELAVKLHNIKEVICIEHERCGAYKTQYPDMTQETEKEVHTANLKIFQKKMAKSYPQLKFLGFYMFIDGTCEFIEDTS